MSQVLLNSESVFVVDTYKEVENLQKEMYENDNVVNFKIIKKETKKDEYYVVKVKIENMTEKDCRVNI